MIENEFYEDLLIAAHDVLERNPDVRFDEWVDIIMHQYPTEVTDALGTNPVKVYSSLKLLWERIRGSQGVDFVSDDESINETFKIE